MKNMGYLAIVTSSSGFPRPRIKRNRSSVHRKFLRLQTHPRYRIQPNHTLKKKIYTQEKLNTARIKKEAQNILCLDSYTKHLDKEYKTERGNWILLRCLWQEKELTKMAKKSCSNQKIDFTIENIYFKSGLNLEYPT